MISKVSFTPGDEFNLNAFQARFVVTDSQGHPVQGALVYQVGLPYGWVKNNGHEQATGADGSTTLTALRRPGCRSEGDTHS